jgi:hypothetical protein
VALLDGYTIADEHCDLSGISFGCFEFRAGNSKKKAGIAVLFYR